MKKIKKNLDGITFRLIVFRNGGSPCEVDLISKYFPSSWVGGGLFCHKTKVARNCLKWIDLMSKNFTSSCGGGGGGLFCHKSQSCLKLPEMDRSDVKNLPHPGGGGLFCHINQSCSKLPEMDRSEVKTFPSSCGRGGFSATKAKVAGNCLKWIDLM